MYKVNKQYKHRYCSAFGKNIYHMWSVKITGEVTGQQALLAARSPLIGCYFESCLKFLIIWNNRFERWIRFLLRMCWTQVVWLFLLMLLWVCPHRVSWNIVWPQVHRTRDLWLRVRLPPAINQGFMQLVRCGHTQTNISRKPEHPE